MEFKGTKGKWMVTRTASSSSLRASVNGFKIDCWTQDVNNYDDILETNANAQLIAHAPEMLDMLQKLVKMESIICISGASSEEYLGEEQALNNMINQAKQLIEKATTIK